MPAGDEVSYQRWHHDMGPIELRQIELLDDTITPLVIEAESEGHRFMRRLQDEWHSGGNRFQGQGELLLGAYVNEQLMAIGGLNKDPYAFAENVGRLRHVYVARAVRGSGIGAILVRRIMDDAARSFSVLRLRTTTAEAATFYERLGFERTSEAAATHIIRLGAS